MIGVNEGTMVKTTSVFGFAFQPILQELTTDPDPSWVEAMVGLNASSQGGKSNVGTVAASLAIADFLDLVQQELEATGLGAKDIAKLAPDLKKFIQSPLVQTTLGNIFTQNSPEVDSFVLGNTWGSLGLVSLPEEFNWEELAKAYLQKAKNIALAREFVERLNQPGASNGLTFTQLKDEVFGQHWYYESWHGVLRAIAAMLEPRAVGEIIDYLMHLDNQGNFMNLFVAADCLEQVTSRDLIQASANQLLTRLKNLTEKKELDEKIMLRMRAVTKIATVWHQDPGIISWLKAIAESDLYDSIRMTAVDELARVGKQDPGTVEWLKKLATDESFEITRPSAVRGLTNICASDRELLGMLTTLARSDSYWLVREAAIQEIARVWPTEPETVAILQTSASLDHDSDVRIAALAELARGWPTEPETLAILQKSANGDEDADVRIAALGELARGWSRDEKTWAVLRNRVNSDPDTDVRIAALEELASGWCDRPDTLVCLKNKASSDPDWRVRIAALKILARGWFDDPETLNLLRNSINADAVSDVRIASLRSLVSGWFENQETIALLKNRVKNDENWDVRVVALQELTTGWFEDPETLDILKNCAISDENWAVRLAAAQELAKGWRDIPEILDILKQVATTDQDSFVRQATLQQIAKGWLTGAKLREFLCDRALHDPFTGPEDGSINPRQTALEILLEQYSYHPEIMALLRDRSQHDPDEKLRSFAQKQLKELELKK